MNITVLFDAGLTVNEARVYLALLEIGSSPATEITKKSKVHRVNVYDVLERLQTKGLVNTITKKGKKFYEASNPDELLNLLETRKENVRESIPELKLMYNCRKEKQDVHYFKGPQGVFNAYNMILEQGETMYALGGSGLNRKILKHRHVLWDNERVKRKIHAKALYYESLRSEKKSDKERLWEIKFIPDKFKNDVMVDICGSLVVILLPQIKQDDIMAVVIDNRKIADGYRKMFDFFWEHAKS